MKGYNEFKSALDQQIKNRKFERKEILNIYKRIISYIKSYYILLIFAIVSIAMYATIDAGLTWSLKPLLDKGFINRDQQFIDLLPLFVMIAFLFRGTASFISTYSITKISRNMIMEIRQQLFAKMLTLPAFYYDKNSSGQLVSTLIYNVNQISQASATTLIILVRETVFIIGLLTVMLLVSWKLALLFFVTAPFIALTAAFSSKKMRKYGRRLQRGMGDVTQIAEESIDGYRVIRTFGGQDYERDKFNKATMENRRQEMQLVVTNALASPIVQLIIAVVISITIYLATTSAMGQITAGGFASMIAAMLAILKPLKNITTINNNIQRGVVGAEGVFQILDHESEKDDGTLEIGRVKGAIEYKNINFNYNTSDRMVLHDLNFAIEPGQTIAFVGKSGSGKSTLVNLLPRFYDGYEGLITVDGIDIRDVKLQALRTQFAFVSQHVTLFNDTVKRNIGYGRFENVSEEEIIKVAKTANAWDFIKEMPEGLNTIVGDNGLLLSGGQRQRIAIARALLKDAPILILDEATSSLDSESERNIQEALSYLMKDRTTLVVAHRLSTIENADRIIVLKNGRVVETGKHKQLIALNGEYARLYAMQFNEFTDTDGTEESSESVMSAETVPA